MRAWCTAERGTSFFRTRLLSARSGHPQICATFLKADVQRRSSAIVDEQSVGPSHPVQQGFEDVIYGCVS